MGGKVRLFGRLCQDYFSEYFICIFLPEYGIPYDQQKKNAEV